MHPDRPTSPHTTATGPTPAGAHCPAGVRDRDPRPVPNLRTSRETR